MTVLHVGAELFLAGGRTDGRTDMTKPSRFCNFENSLKKCSKRRLFASDFFKHEKEKMEGVKEGSSRTSRPTPIKGSDEDIKFLKCFRPSQHLG